MERSIKMFENASILITGGTGSFGRAFVARILKDNPRRLVVYSRGEHAQEEMAREIQHPNIRFNIGDVRDLQRLEMAVRGCEIIIHAAALKIVPIAEYNPFEAVYTNIVGAQNVVRCAISQKVRRVIALSTDKCVNPTNLYGATKLCAERLFMAAHNLGGDGGPLFSVVRYGNVLNSRGSVVPFFEKLAEQGNTLPITHPAMTRFIITMPQAVDFVLNCLQNMRGNEIFIPRIPSIKIMDLAKAVWGKYQTSSCPVEIVGVRPGEKLHEVLLSVDEAPKTTQLPSQFIINGQGSGLPEGFSYTSDNNNEWLSVGQFGEMIASSEQLRLGL